MKPKTQTIHTLIMTLIGQHTFLSSTWILSNENISTAGVVQVELNLTWTFITCDFLLQQMHIKKMFNIKNVGQGHGLQYSQCSHSMADINLYNRRTWAFFASTHHFRDIDVSKFVTFKMSYFLSDGNMNGNNIPAFVRQNSRWKILTWKI